MLAFLASFVFMPLSALYFFRIRANKNIRGLNKFFRRACWTFLIILITATLLILVFILYVAYDTAMISSYWQRDLWAKIGYQVPFHFISQYIDNSGLSLWDVELIIDCWPDFIVLGLFYWAMRINKTTALEKN